MDIQDHFQTEFIAQCIHRIDENVKRIEICMEDLTEEEIWNKPNTSTNSIGNLILHLCGNIRQYVISSIGAQEDKRERDKEFSSNKTYTREQLLEKFLTTISETKSVLKNVSEEELKRKRIVQGFHYSGIGIVIHITEHLSYHTGQIALLKKLMRNKDLEFYKGIDLNNRNQ